MKYLKCACGTEIGTDAYQCSIDYDQRSTKHLNRSEPWITNIRKNRSKLRIFEIMHFRSAKLKTKCSILRKGYFMTKYLITGFWIFSPKLNHQFILNTINIISINLQRIYTNTDSWQSPAGSPGWFLSDLKKYQR